MLISASETDATGSEGTADLISAALLQPDSDRKKRRLMSESAASQRNGMENTCASLMVFSGHSNTSIRYVVSSGSAHFLYVIPV